MICHDHQRKIDALGLALGLCRNVMIDVMNGSHDPQEIERILMATSLSNIAAAIGEEDIELSWDETLKLIEHQMIAGIESHEDHEE